MIFHSEKLERAPFCVISASKTLDSGIQPTTNKKKISGNSPRCRESRASHETHNMRRKHRARSTFPSAFGLKMETTRAPKGGWKREAESEFPRSRDSRGGNSAKMMAFFEEANAASPGELF